MVLGALSVLYTISGIICSVDIVHRPQLEAKKETDSFQDRIGLRPRAKEKGKHLLSHVQWEYLF